MCQTIRVTCLWYTISYRYQCCAKVYLFKKWICIWNVIVLSYYSTISFYKLNQVLYIFSPRKMKRNAKVNFIKEVNINWFFFDKLWSLILVTYCSTCYWFDFGPSITYIVISLSIHQKFLIQNYCIVQTFVLWKRMLIAFR